MDGPTGPPTPPEQITIGSLAWEMAQWEVHYLRGMVSSMVGLAIVARRQRLHMRHLIGQLQAMRATYLANMQRALVDPEYRRNPIRDLTLPE